MQGVINFYFAAYKFDNPLFHAFLPYIWPRFPTALEKYFLLLIEVQRLIRQIFFFVQWNM